MNPEIFENQLLNARILTAQNAEPDHFLGYCNRLRAEGFSQREIRPGYASFRKDNIGCFVSYYAAINELRVVTERDCAYFSYSDTCGKAIVAPQITQVHLEDFGMSYVIRLSDGRFILIDGGCSYEPDADRLFAALKQGAPTEIPVVAAWIMSHAHSDHYHCFLPFMEKYGKEIQIEKMLFNFPAADDTDHYPEMTTRDPRREVDTSNTAVIPQFLKLVEESGAAVYTPHTGQIYRIGDAVCEILSSPDDTVHCSPKLNASSLVIRMELGGQTILWSTDASFSYAKLAERCGDRLKADILQIPHHGFGGGDHQDQIRAFDLIQPKVCFLPASDYVAYTFFSAFIPGTRHLIENLEVEEIISGDKTRTITLPYHAPAYAKKQYQRQFENGQSGAGAKNWYFTELSTACAEDFIYTVINPTAYLTKLTAEFFFEGAKPKVLFIQAEIPRNQMIRLNLTDPEQVETELEYFNPNSLKSRGLPENEPFAVRFFSDSPLVISHKKHKDAYHG